MAQPRKSVSDSVTTTPLSIEQLQSKYEELHRKKIEAETRHKVTLAELETLRTQARTTWGTDDVEELKMKLVQMQRENEARRAKYQSDLESIETKLEEIDQKFSKLE
jgi:autotransporter translocation and assembly factor TamB